MTNTIHFCIVLEMKYLELKAKLRTNVFRLADVYKYFPDEPAATVQMQLSRFVKRGLLNRLKRELYCFDLDQVEPFALANKLVEPSYVSLETALNFYGMIPDIPQTVTSVTTAKTDEFNLKYGRFSFYSVKERLYFGFVRRLGRSQEDHYLLAEPEKALLDWFYLRKLTDIADLRLDLTRLDRSKLVKYQALYPERVRRVKFYD